MNKKVVLISDRAYYYCVELLVNVGKDSSFCRILRDSTLIKKEG